ncbi:gephyrin-like molybdotransferase Glp [Alkalibacter saccharofermentans]|uniref:Molybdopterin molybdenumtransferase n=1 Tax=Alkalibacter saccharofermentans DSM 14828 TaxID=1120975 RepID=A0A1M4TNG8_9FIRM|nr:gephyrin-like molybdotransferase Glp [Alkalibacter saccharofermentans]SHE46040.1 molybdopterin molybdotransferase [Alkalibacter saccharofermentans DSM 14828]
MMFEVKTVKETFGIIEDNFSDYDLDGEWVGIHEALDRVVCKDIIANEDMPPFNRSSVDGYCVVAADTFGVSEAMPAQLKLVGEVGMGEKPGFAIKRGESAYVPTGGQLPSGADAMVMMEYSEDFKDGDIFLNKPAAPGNHIVYKGDDVKEGTLVIKKGRRLRAQDIAILAGLGYEKVKVYKKLKIGIISTGDEVIGIGDKPEGAQIRDINTYSIDSLSKKMGMEPVRFGIVKDVYDDIEKVVNESLESCDITVVSGGSSVGTKDVTVKVIESLGKPGVLLHGIAVKPGKPTILGKAKGKAVIGLPGHPASAFMIFQVFVSRLAKTMEKSGDGLHPFVEATVDINYPSNNGREEYLAVSLREGKDRCIASPVFGKSGMISLMTQADGFVHISRGSEGLNKGQKVKVNLF